MPAASIARVLLDSPLPQLDRLFDYRIPPQFAQDAVPGVRVRVPLRSAGRVADGFLDRGRGRGRLLRGPQRHRQRGLPGADPGREVWTLARAVADRAAGGASDVVRLAVPKRQVRVEKAWLEHPDDARFEVRPVDIPDFDTAAFDDAVAHGGRLAAEALPIVREVAGRPVGRPLGGHARSTGHPGAGARIGDPRRPDYRDQDQLVAALEAVLPAAAIVRLDARQSNPDRYRGLLACLGETPRVIVGNRSVVYAPGPPTRSDRRVG